MSQDVDHRRLREHQPDQPKVGLIEGHLVGEPTDALAHCAELPGALQVVVAEEFEALGLVPEPKVGKGLGVGQWAAQQPRGQLDHFADGRQLIAGGDGRMGAQGLLDHRGA